MGVDLAKRQQHLAGLHDRAERQRGRILRFDHVDAVVVQIVALGIPHDPGQQARVGRIDQRVRDRDLLQLPSPSGDNITAKSSIRGTASCGKSWYVLRLISWVTA